MPPRTIVRVFPVPGPSHADRATRRARLHAIDDLVRHVKEGIVAGRIRDGDPTLIAHAILGVTGHLSRVFIHERDEPTDEVADAAVTFCLEGILARA